MGHQHEYKCGHCRWQGLFSALAREPRPEGGVLILCPSCRYKGTDPACCLTAVPIESSVVPVTNDY